MYGSEPLYAAIVCPGTLRTIPALVVEVEARGGIAYVRRICEDDVPWNNAITILNIHIMELIDSAVQVNQEVPVIPVIETDAPISTWEWLRRVVQLGFLNAA